MERPRSDIVDGHDTTHGRTIHKVTLLMVVETTSRKTTYKGDIVNIR